MASRDRDPAAATIIRRMNERGGVARLVGALLSYGLDDHGDFDSDRLNRHLTELDQREALHQSTEILKAATVEPDIGPVALAMIDAALESYGQRDARQLGRWFDNLAVVLDEAEET